MAKAKANNAAQPDLLDGDVLGMPPPILKEAFDAWNEHASKIANWPTVKTLDEGRRAKLKKAIRTCSGLIGWKAMLVEATKSDVLTGRASWAKGSKWFNFDWLIKPANLVKVLDGNYENAEAAPVTFAERMKGVGVKASYAEPPKPFVQTETLEQRLAASIVSYRRHGKHADANRIEERLAALEKREPVLVPAPSVAHIGMPERPAEIPRRPSRPVTDLDGWDMVPEGAEHDADD